MLIQFPRFCKSFGRARHVQILALLFPNLLLHPSALEIDFLKNAAATLPGVPLVVMFPVWYLKTGPVRLEQVWKKMKDLGYEAILPPGSPVPDPTRPSIVYRRADQFVGREIVILKPIVAAKK